MVALSTAELARHEAPGEDGEADNAVGVIGLDGGTLGHHGARCIRQRSLTTTGCWTSAMATSSTGRPSAAPQGTPAVYLLPARRARQRRDASSTRRVPGGAV